MPGAEQKPSFWEQFRQFISRGNVIDLAVGIIVGGAFSQIVNSLVHDLIMPPLGLIIGKVNLVDLKFVLQNAGTDPTGKPIPEVAITYGNFLQTLFNFIIIALIVFLLVRAFTAVREFEEKRLRKKKPEEPSEPPPEEEIDVLKDIRTLLSKQKK